MTATEAAAPVPETAAPEPRRRARRATRPAPAPRPAPVPIARRRWLLDLGAIALLLAVPVAGFANTFDGPRYLVAALGGLILGLAIAAVGAWRRWGILVVAAAVVVAYFVLGGPLALPHTAIAGVVPTLDTLLALAVGIVTAWKSLLTTVAPVSAADGHMIVPFVLLLVTATLAGSLALRLRTAAWALLPVAAGLALQIALGTSQPVVPVVQGIVLALAAVVWLSVREAWAPTRSAIAVSSSDMPRPDRRHVIRRAATAGGVLAVAAAVGGAATLLGPAHEIRYVIRDAIIPPFDIREFPSPLQDFRLYVDEFEEKTLFTVSGLPEDARVRLGTMDAYSGVVYNVADSSSAFTPLRSNMAEDVRGERAEVHVEIGEYSDVWLPDTGAVDAVEFEGADADALRRATYFNPGTGTGVVSTGLSEGDAYTLSAVVPAEPSEAQLADDVFADVDVPEPAAVPDRLAELAADAISDAEASTPYEKVKALQTYLVDAGFFSHGLDPEDFSPSGHGSARLAMMADSEQMVGDDEQYASLMALMAYEVGIPARVVMGFHDEEGAGGELVATGDNLHAWVEVAFRESGWVAFDPTPDEDKDPKDQTTKPKTDPQPMPLQPPPPPKEDADEPPLVPDDREAEDEAEPIPGFLAAILAIGGISIGVLALLIAPFVIIGALKAAKRRKRREAPVPADRLSGGWDELMDRAADYGRGVPAGATRYEQSLQLVDTLEEPRVTALAVRADAGVFGAGDPSPAEVDAFWAEIDEVVGGLGSRASLGARLRARLNVTSLAKGSSLAARIRALRETVQERAVRPGGKER